MVVLTNPWPVASEGRHNPPTSSVPYSLVVVVMVVVVMVVILLLLLLTKKLFEIDVMCCGLGALTLRKRCQALAGPCCILASGIALAMFQQGSPFRGTLHRAPRNAVERSKHADSTSIVLGVCLLIQCAFQPIRLINVVTSPTG